MAEIDSLELKKRARRRLVGSVALALLAAIVLPMAMDHEPPELQGDVQIHIPQQGSGPYAEKPQAVKPAVDAPGTTPSPAESEADEDPDNPPPPVADKPAVVARPAPVQVVKPEIKPETRPTPTVSEAERARALLEGRVPTLPAPTPAPAAAEAGYVVQIGAYRDAANAQAIRDKLKAAGFAAYTEKLEGTTRVRLGPFASRESADGMVAKLQKQGYSSVVASR